MNTQADHSRCTPSAHGDLPSRSAIGRYGQKLERRLSAIRASTGVPVGVGFGIRDAATAGAVAAVADAVVVGSRIIEEIERAPAGEACARVKALVADLRRGIDAAHP